MENNIKNISDRRKEQCDFFYLNCVTKHAFLVLKVKVLLTQFLDERSKIHGKEFITHYFDYYMQYALKLSEDEVGVVSKTIFAVFFLLQVKDRKALFVYPTSEARIKIHLFSSLIIPKKYIYDMLFRLSVKRVLYIII